jgi:hypothetical protein
MNLNIRTHAYYSCGVLVTGCLAFLFGYSKGYRTPIVVRAVHEFETIQERLIEVQKLETRTVWRTEKKPDGTVLTETKQELVEEKKQDKQQERVTNRQELETVSVPLSTFSIGFGANPDRQPYGELGYRIFGNVWTELQGSPKEISLGVRLDW